MSGYLICGTRISLSMEHFLDDVKEDLTSQLERRFSDEEIEKIIASIDEELGGGLLDVVINVEINEETFEVTALFAGE